MQDLRDNIRTNWSTTGQELSRELRQFWPASRPQSPARYPASFNGEGLSPASAVRSPGLGPGSNNNMNDFVAGYAVGLIGGVRSWVSVPGTCAYGRVPTTNKRQMTKPRNRDMDSSRPPSDDDSEESDRNGNERVQRTVSAQN